MGHVCEWSISQHVRTENSHKSPSKPTEGNHSETQEATTDIFKMADYKVGDLANLISSSRQSNEKPTDDFFGKKKNKKRTVQIETDNVQKPKKKKHEERDNEPAVANTQEPQ